MPTYEYECGDCGHEFELFQSITDRVRRKCPECGARKLKRLIGPGGAVIFKGSGFYQTDYRSASYEKGAQSAKAERQSAKSSAGKDAGTAKKDSAKKATKKKN